MRFVDLDSFDLIEILRPYCSFGDCCDIEDEIEKKVLDAQPVVHGKWIDTEFCGPHYMKIVQCSVCKDESEGSIYDEYCPHCGARMDGE